MDPVLLVGMGMIDCVYQSLHQPADRHHHSRRHAPRLSTPKADAKQTRASHGPNKPRGPHRRRRLQIRHRLPARRIGIARDHIDDGAHTTSSPRSCPAGVLLAAFFLGPQAWEPGGEVTVPPHIIRKRYVWLSSVQLLLPLRSTYLWTWKCSRMFRFRSHSKGDQDAGSRAAAPVPSWRGPDRHDSSTSCPIWFQAGRAVGAVEPSLGVPAHADIQCCTGAAVRRADVDARLRYAVHDPRRSCLGWVPSFDWI